MSNAKRTILFDIGNVLIGVDFPPFYRKVFGERGPSPDVLSRFLELRDLGDTGRISRTDFIEEVSLLTQRRTSPEEVLEAWNGILSPIAVMWEIVYELKSAGHRLILFSNTNRLHLDHILLEYPILKEFSEAHYSCEIGFLKPDSQFYHEAIERYDLVPEETLYLDDLPENIATGENMGFRCHRYQMGKHLDVVEWFRETVFLECNSRQIKE